MRELFIKNKSFASVVHNDFKGRYFINFT